MNMIFPQYLYPGDRVSVIAPSGVVEKNRVERGISFLEAWGLEVIRGEHLYRASGMFAGDDTERLNDLQRSLDDESVKALFCARGGYGLSRIIDSIKMDRLIATPKWIIGYSDITVLHLWLNSRYNLATIHGEMVSNYNIASRSPESLDSLKGVLFGRGCSYSWKSSKFRQGKASAIIAGGNLSLIVNLMGTGVKDWLKGKILFIEDTGEYLYRIDRMMMDLRLSGVLGNLSGLVVGKFSAIMDTDIPFGKSNEDIIMDAVSGFDYPVVFDFPAGHIYDNRAFFLGTVMRLEVKAEEATLSMDAAD